MTAELAPAEAGLYREMSERVREMERLATELRELGRGLPVVERNTGAILSLTRILGFGISDLADALDS
jgi:hypothetical protein